MEPSLTEEATYPIEIFPGICFPVNPSAFAGFEQIENILDLEGVLEQVGIVDAEGGDTLLTRPMEIENHRLWGEPTYGVLVPRSGVCPLQQLILGPPRTKTRQEIARR